MAITALLNLKDEEVLDAAREGVRWLLTMQSSKGGWASWDRNDRSWIQIPGGGPWFARDIASPEITARIVVLFSRIIRGQYSGLEDLAPQVSDGLRRGLQWLMGDRRDGIWFGRWFTHYLYGTCHALEAYREVGHLSGEIGIKDTLLWLHSIVNADGGFGEASGSGREGKFVGAASTPFHTGCALLALAHAGAAQHPIAERAAQWLLDHQEAQGDWINRDFFAAGVPGVWYANFELSSTYFAAKSLLAFKQNSISLGLN
jgi:squalene-hopene/tetraprenyl-beta-curcumene cyclase